MTNATIHKVTAGETLSGIAKRFGTTVARLASLNRIQDVDRIRIGMLLKLPDRSVPNLAARPTHTVVKGETLSEIAVRYHSSVRELAQLNHLRDPDLIPVGLVLRLPGSAAPAPAAPDIAKPNRVAAPVDSPRPPAGGGISGKQLLMIMPSLASKKAAAYLPWLNAAMGEGSITTPLRMAAFLAQIAHESGQLRWFQELASGAEYEGRKSLGNTHPGDGRRYKGRGPIQLTGRANYTAAGKALHLDLVGNPDQVATPQVGFRVAVWFWTTHGLNGLADQRRFDDITRRVNGALNGKTSRDAYYRRAKQVLGA